MNPLTLQSRRIDVVDSYQAIQDYYEDSRGGPTAYRWCRPRRPLVRDMLLSLWPEDPADIPRVSSSRAMPEVTLEKVAVNAVMAGCRPGTFSGGGSGGQGGILQAGIQHSRGDARQPPEERPRRLS